MTEGDLRSRLIADVNAGRSELLASLDGLSEKQTTVPARDGWSVRDHLAHLAAWDELRFYEISRVGRGDRGAFTDVTGQQVEAFNSWTFGLRRDWPLAQVMRELEYARSRVLEAIAACADSHLPEAAEGRGRIRRAAGHDREHVGYIREWRQGEGL